jgi:hypothetical protein
VARQQQWRRPAAAFFLLAALARAQAPSDAQMPAATMKQIMLDLIHPSSNEILLVINRGGPKEDKEWAAVRRSALTLAESGALLLRRAPVHDLAEWAKDARMLADAGAAAYKAAQAKDTAALAAMAAPLDQSCTACHRQYRPNVFPRQGGS